MATTKRTSAKIAKDIFGQTIRLFNNKLTSSRGQNSLSYQEVRDAIAQDRQRVWTVVRGFGSRERGFGRLDSGDVRYYASADGGAVTPVVIGDPYFRIGCHIFTLAMFNRILRAAGVRTTKPQTLKTFAATA